MKAMDASNRIWSRMVVTAASVTLLITAAGCAGREEVGRLSAAAPMPGSPIVVRCEPMQRTMVRPTVVNGVAVSQVECVAGDTASPAIATDAAVAPSSLSAVSQPVLRLAPDSVVPRSETAAHADDGTLRMQSELPDAEVAAVRPAVATRHVVVDEDTRVRRRRSVAKSAVIIGSSAGAGAGLGAVIGGRKGALVGAAIGGGGATLWDQITRRKD